MVHPSGQEMALMYRPWNKSFQDHPGSNIASQFADNSSLTVAEAPSINRASSWRERALSKKCTSAI